MNRSHTALVLAKIAAIDNRRLDDPRGNQTPILDAWHESIGDLRYEDCLQAVADHRSESTEWLLPAHIVRRVKEMRAERVRGLSEGDFTPDVGPVNGPDEVQGYLTTLRARRALVVDGVPLEAAIAMVPVPAGVPLSREARRELTQ